MLHAPTPAPVTPGQVPSHPPPRSGTRRRRHRRARAWRAALLVASAVLIGAACGDSEREPAAAPDVDAGLNCERGTLGCICVGGSGCQDDLLCIAGRCLANDESPPEPSGSPPQGLPSNPVPSSPDPEADAGEAPSPASDAGSDVDAGSDGG